MMQLKGTIRYHLMALTAVIIWGITFVSTKILLEHGLSPADIMLYRFILAYGAMWTICHNKLRADSWRDEGTFLLAGLFGGSLYFLTENTALEYTQATNVSIIISAIPLISAILTCVVMRMEHLSRRVIIGAVVSLSGVTLVVLNGRFELNLNPLGDILTLVAATTWALYNIIVMKLDKRYSVLFITRKVFFYGLVTLLPFYLFEQHTFDMAVMTKSVVWGNLLFLGILASFGCYIIWNIALSKIGSIKSSNYLYLSPLVTYITSAIILDEVMTLTAAIGSIMILLGVYIAARLKKSS